MIQRRIQLFLILGVLAITLYFSVLLGRDVSHYFALQKEAKAQVTQWEIVPVKDRFALRAAYNFQIQEKTCPGIFTLLPPYHLNELAALSALKERAKEEWRVWYDPHHPGDSALEKRFPMNLMIRCLICYSVLIYFFNIYKKVITV